MNTPIFHPSNAGSARNPIFLRELVFLFISTHRHWIFHMLDCLRPSGAQNHL